MRKFAVVTLLGAVAALPQVAMGAPAVGDLVRALEADPAARVEAVQLLSRYGVEPVPLLLPLLDHENGTVAKAAHNVLWSICNHAARPGSTVDALEVSRQLLERLAEDPSDATTRKLLRLLAIAVPEGSDITPLAQRLADADWREKARTTLERIGTAEARAALRGALPDADAPFKAALLYSLADLSDREGVPLAQELASHDDPRVRAAAARLLAGTGDPAALVAVRSVRERATDDTRFEAEDALVRLAEAMVGRGGNWQLAMNLYLEVLGATNLGVLRDAALTGLGTHGDETVVGPILRAAQDAPERTRLAAVAALGMIRGPAADKAIVEAYPGQPEPIRAAMLPMLGRRGGEAVLPALIEAAGSDDAATRITGLRALGDAGRFGGVPALVESLGSDDEATRTAALDSALRIARSLRASGDSDNAGRAYAEVFKAAPSPEVRRDALEGIIACPVAEAFEVILAAGPEVDLGELSGPALIAAIGALAKADRLDEAEKILDRLLESPLTGPPVGDLVARLGPHAERLRIAQRLGFVTDWWIVGPFPFGGPGTGLGDVNVGEPDVDLTATYKVGDKEPAWAHHPGSASATQVSLMAIYGMVERQACYAYAAIDVTEAQDVVFRMGSDDGIKLWVNGEVVHENDTDRGCVIDEDAAPAKLTAGRNALLAKISQGAGGWGFSLRITTPDGRPVPVEIVEQ